MRRCSIVLCLMVFCPVLVFASAAPVVLPVSGTLVQQNGRPLNGPVPVRFQIVDGKGAVLWQSDETSPVQLQVENGRYSVELGNRAEGNMRVLTPDVLNRKGACYVRVIGHQKKRRIVEDVEVPEKTRRYLNVPPAVREPQGTVRRSAALTLGRGAP